MELRKLQDEGQHKKNRFVHLHTQNMTLYSHFGKQKTFGKLFKIPLIIASQNINNLGTPF